MHCVAEESDLPEVCAGYESVTDVILALMGVLVRHTCFQTQLLYSYAVCLGIHLKNIRCTLGAGSVFFKWVGCLYSLTCDVI